jgi:hypothetical protein
MTYFVSIFDTVDPMANPIRGAALFYAGKPSMTEEELYTPDKAIMVGYGSSIEAAMLALRAGLNTALGAVELEILQRRRDFKVHKVTYRPDAQDDDGITDIEVVDLSGGDEDDAFSNRRCRHG